MRFRSSPMAPIVTPCYFLWTVLCFFVLFSSFFVAFIRPQLKGEHVINASSWNLRLHVCEAHSI
jgi:hypothetical protein